jgi:hypothetical protein
MRRVVAVLLVAGGILGIWWLAEDGRLRDRLSEVTAAPPPANWGDVADKVGEFAGEERALRESIGVIQPPADEGAGTP